MLNDEIVDEVRAIRQAHAARLGYDLRAVRADVNKSEAERLAAGYPIVPPPSVPSEPNFSSQRTRVARRLTRRVT